MDRPMNDQYSDQEATQRLQKKATDQRGERHLPHWHYARHFCLHRKTGDTRSDILIFFRGLWQPTE